MDMCLYFSICAWAVVLMVPVTHASMTGDIILTPVNSSVIYSFDSSELLCNTDCDVFGTCCDTCDVYVSSPSGTILNATFLALHIPSDETITFINRNTSEDLISLSGISSLIDPIYSDPSHMKISFYWCDDPTPNLYFEAEFSFLDRFQDSLVQSSGGAFELSDAFQSITIQSVNLSSSTDLEGQLHWFITSSNYTWIKIDILVMEPGQGMLCIFDTFDSYGEWVCMTDSVSSTTWYSYDDEMRMTFYINQNQQPGVGLTVNLSIIDHSLWTGQYLILPACNPTVILEDTQTIQFVTPYFNQSLQNVRYQCRMRFTSKDAPASVEFKHFDLPAGEVSIYSLDSGNRVDLADALGTQVDISSHSPVVCISPTHMMILDVYKHGYPGDGNGLMVQAYTFDPRPKPIASFGIAVELNDTSSSRSFTTLGYPILPGGDINVRWYIDKALQNTAIKVEFIDFDIGIATLFIHEMDDPPIYQLTGSSLPEDIYSDTQMLTFVLRSDQPCCTRGFYFNVTLIPVFDECTNATCENGGTCIETFLSFRCSCPIGFTGSLCQNLITTVKSGLPTTQAETSTPVKSTLKTSTSRTTYRSETSSPVKSTLGISTSRTTSHIETKPPPRPTEPVTEHPPSSDDNNILIIALSISLTIAFGLIAFLVCVVVYRSSRNASVAAPTNPEFCSQNDLIPRDNSTPRYQEHPVSGINHEYMLPDSTGVCGFTHPNRPNLPPDPPPEYETIKDLQVGGAVGGSYVDLDLSAVRPEGEYEKLRGKVTTPSGKGTHQNPPDPPHYTSSPISPSTPFTPGTPVPPVTQDTTVTSVTPDYMRSIQVSPAGNRDSECSYVDPDSIHDIRMNGTSPPPLYDSNIHQTTTFHS